MRPCHSLLAILLFFSAYNSRAQTARDYSTIIPGTWVSIESLPTAEIEDPRITSYFKYEFVPDSTFFFATHAVERGSKNKYRLNGDTIQMFNTKFHIQSFTNGELRMQATIKLLNQTHQAILVRKEKYDSIWRLRKQLRLVDVESKPVFKGDFYLYNYVTSEFTTPADYLRDRSLNPFKPVPRPPNQDIYIKMKIAVDPNGNVKAGTVMVIPAVSQKRIEKIRRKIENTSGYWAPAERNGAAVSDSLDLTFVTYGTTSLKIKMKSIQFLRSALDAFHKQDYMLAIAEVTAAINLDPNKYYFYLLRAACRLHQADVDRYCQDMFKAYVLHPLVNLENVEMVDGKPLHINCGEQ